LTWTGKSFRMKPLIVLFITFGLALLAVKIFRHDWNFIFAGNVAMSAMLLFTSLGHFMFPKGMAMMIPAFIPSKILLIYLTGVIEIAAAIGLHILSMRPITAVLLIIFFILLLPANIYAAIHKVNLEKANHEGSGLNYLWFRVPLQAVFIAWVWYFCL
jgi:uncharacterized membrane protein